MSGAVARPGRRIACSAAPSICGWMSERVTRLERRDDDLRAEPSLDEALADPVIQAVMSRDGVTRDDVVRVALAARARLLAQHDGVIAAFPIKDLAPEIGPPITASGCGRGRASRRSSARIRRAGSVRMSDRSLAAPELFGDRPVYPWLQGWGAAARLFVRASALHRGRGRP